MSSTLPAHSSLAAVVQEQLGRVGIDVTVNALAGAEVSEATLRQDVEMNLSFVGALDPSVVLRDYFSATGATNPGRHTTPDLADAIERSSQPGDGRDAALQEAAEIIVDEALMVSIAVREDAYAMSPEVTGWQHYVSMKPEFRGVSVSD